MTDSLPLSDLLARRLNLQWYEGVAIVRGVAELLSGYQGTAVRIPELHQIELSADGSVALAGGAVVKEPVRRLGQLLQALLTDAQVPVQLRLIVSQATAPIPSYSTTSEFDQALAYFERPGRAGALQVLFLRAQAAGPVTAGDVAMTLDRIAPLPDAKPPRRPSVLDVKNPRRLIGIAAACLAVFTLSASATFYAPIGAATLRGRQVSRATVAAADVVGAAVMAGVSAVSNSVGLGRIVAADAVDPPFAPPAVVPSAPRRRVNAPGTVAAPAANEPAGAGVENLPLRTIVVYDPPEGLASVSEAPAGLTETLEPSAALPIDQVVYTPGAYGVSPPVALHQKLPRELPSTVDPASLSRIDLVIARDGTVESAKLLGSRRDVQGGMFLSAAKAWEFRPAMKDGVAVRYRKTILVSFE